MNDNENNVSDQGLGRKSHPVALLLLCIVFAGIIWLVVLMVLNAKGTSSVNEPFSYDKSYLSDSRVVYFLRSSEAYTVIDEDVEIMEYQSCVNVSGFDYAFEQDDAVSRFYVKTGVDNDSGVLIEMNCLEDISVARKKIGGYSLLTVLASPSREYIRDVRPGVEGMEQDEEFYVVHGRELRKYSDLDGVSWTLLVYDVPVSIKEKSGDTTEIMVRVASLADESASENEFKWPDNEVNPPRWTDVVCLNDRCVEARLSRYDEIQ